MIRIEEFELAASVVPTSLQYSLLEVIAEAGAASDGLLRRIIGLDSAQLREEVDELQRSGLIRPTEARGPLIDHFCYRHHDDNHVGVVGYQ